MTHPYSSTDLAETEQQTWITQDNTHESLNKNSFLLGLQKDLSETFFLPIERNEKASFVAASESYPDVSGITLYPHLYDGDTQSAKALRYIEESVLEVQKAIEDLDSGDLPRVWASLGILDSLVTKSIKCINFNESLAAALTSIKQGIKNMDIGDLDRSALNSLAATLRSLHKRPTLALNETADLIDGLEENGWACGNEDVDDFIDSLLAIFDAKIDQKNEKGVEWAAS